MDAVEYLKARIRMCRSYSPCSDCPLNNNCTNDEITDPLTVIEAVERWAKEHPAKTRQDEFMKMFPNVHTYNGVIVIAPCTIDKSIYGTKCIHSCDECTRKYWTEEIE